MKLRCLLACFALAACSGSSPPPPPPGVPSPPPPPAGGAEPTAQGGATPDSAAGRFAAVRDRVLAERLADDPAFGRMLGLHEFDGKVADYAASAIQGRIERLRKAAADLGAVEKTGLSADDTLDLALLQGQVDLALFKLVDLAEWQLRPAFYGDLFEVDAYVNRDYAPLEERARRLLAHERAALGGTPHVLENLKSPMPKPVVETAIKIYKGYAEYLRGDVVRIVGGAGDAAFKEAFAKANEALAKEADKIAEHLKKVELPKADQSFALGKERYLKLLKVQEGLTIPLAELKKMGEDDLAANKKAFIELKAKAKVSRPKATDLFGDATKLTDSARRFIVDKKLATIPTDDKATLKETPPYMRWNSAFLDMPGPFDTAKVSFYYITLPDPTWPKKEQEEYVMTTGILLSTTIHEVYPGHFLQGQWIRRAPTRAQKMLASYSFVEGWAHYGEQMMIEEGFGVDDPQNHLGQLSDALLRNCRVVASLGLHAEGMTLAAAEQRFINDCFQDKATAREQAIRGTFDPGYFAYTLGKIQILRLRDEAKKRLGDKFSLQRFHDALLSHGSPPIPLIHDRVLAELGAGK